MLTGFSPSPPIPPMPPMPGIPGIPPIPGAPPGICAGIEGTAGRSTIGSFIISTKTSWFAWISASKFGSCCPIAPKT